jgi:hypothetical protein
MQTRNIWRPEAWMLTNFSRFASCTLAFPQLLEMIGFSPKFCFANVFSKCIQMAGKLSFVELMACSCVIRAFIDRYWFTCVIVLAHFEGIKKWNFHLNNFDFINRDLIPLTKAFMKEWIFSCFPWRADYFKLVDSTWSITLLCRVRVLVNVKQMIWKSYYAYSRPQQTTSQVKLIN